MPDERYLNAPGASIAPGALTVPKAIELAKFLESGASAYARLVECRRGKGADTVVFEVEPEVPQIREVEIQAVERVSVSFFDRDDRLPETLALRTDFPDVLHRNLRPAGWLPSLCLWDEPYEELKPRWTAARYVARVREWLSLTAVGELHQPDQGLEPLLSPATPKVICPHELFLPGSTGVEERLIVSKLDDGTGEYTYFLSKPDESERNDANFVAVVITAPPQTHAVMRHQPQTIAELDELLRPTGFDLLGELRTRFTRWLREESHQQNSLCILLRLPKRRSDEGPVEAVEVWAFLTVSTVREVGIDIGVAASQNGVAGMLIGGFDRDKVGMNTGLAVLAPIATLSRAAAAMMNGYEPNTISILGIGFGALGSQVTTNLIRGGFGVWRIVDSDVLLPHNTARHALPQFALGLAKANAGLMLGQVLVEEDAVAGWRRADVRDAEKFTDAELEGIEVIADFSASVTVARHLALDRSTPARRVSLFLNPDGTDLVVLAEDSARQARLDSLEMQYYRAVLNHPDLEGHLRATGEAHRYANSCRDVSFTVSQENVALFAAIGARALRHAIENPQASMKIWRATADLSVTCIEIAPAETVARSVGPWTVVYDRAFLTNLQALRAAKLPRETGGVVLGTYDLERRIVYLLDSIQPPDSDEWPTHYIRGTEGLEEAVNRASKRTLGSVEYVGEWHSHPDGHGVERSSDDLKVSAWICGYLVGDGLPGLMLIMGAGGQLGIYLEQE